MVAVQAHQMPHVKRVLMAQLQRVSLPRILLSSAQILMNVH